MWAVAAAQVDFLNPEKWGACSHDRWALFLAQLHDFGADAKSTPLKQLTLIVHRQAVVMTFADVFLILSIL